MNTDVVIRPAKSEDIVAMAELISLIFSLEKDFSVDAVKQRHGLEMFFKYPDGRYLLVAEQQQRVIGMCSAQLLVSTAEGGWKALIEDVVVAKGFHGRGIGRKLLASLAEWAERQGARRMDLLADSSNGNGLNFYDHLQWKKTNLIALQKR
jgi:ribosomal protein S18 acetylase RimI-like enzyme